MNSENLHFNSEEERQKYLNDLARLNQIRRQSRDAAKDPSDNLDVPFETGENKLEIPPYVQAPPYVQTPAGGSMPAPPVKEKKKKKHHTVRNILLILSLILISFGVYNMFFRGDQKGYYTIAVFGVDSRNGNLGKDALSDVNMIVRIDRESGEVKIASVYRDTYVKINQKGVYHKFNEAYFRGGPEEAIWTMENNLDVHPDDYVTFNWKAVVDSVNIMGGVDIDITEPEFKYINSFITETVNSTGVGSVQLEHAGQNHLDGVQAVAYARLRLMDTDYNRTERQRRVLSLLVDKIKKASLTKRIELVTSVLPETSTSMTIDDVLPFAKNAGKYYIGDTTGFPFDKVGVDVGKKDCVVAVTLESNVIALHQFLFNDASYAASSAVKDISNHIIKETGLSGDGKKVTVKADDKSGAPIGPTDTKAGYETQPEVPIDATTNPVAETDTEAQTEEESTTAEETSKSGTVTPATTASGEKGPGVVKSTTEASSEDKGPGVTAAPTKESESAKEPVTVPSSEQNEGPGANL